MTGNNIISKSSLQILQEIQENPGTTLTEIQESIGKSYISLSRQFREDKGPEFLKQLIVKERGEDRRKKKLWITDGKEDEVGTLVEALNIIEKYEDQ